MDSHVPVYDVRTIEEVLSSQLAQTRLSSGLLAGFAVIGLLLTSIGIYGTMAYFVSSHVRDRTVRLALGGRTQAAHEHGPLASDDTHAFRCGLRRYRS